MQSENWISIWCSMFSKLSPGAQRPVFRLIYGLGFKGLQWSCCRDRTFSVNEYWRTSHSYHDSHSVLYNLELVPLIFSGEASVAFPKSVAQMSPSKICTRELAHLLLGCSSSGLCVTSDWLHNLCCTEFDHFRTWFWDLLETCCSDCLSFFTFNVNVSKIDFNDI